MGNGFGKFWYLNKRFYLSKHYYKAGISYERKQPSPFFGISLWGHPPLDGTGEKKFFHGVKIRKKERKIPDKAGLWHELDYFDLNDDDVENLYFSLSLSFFTSSWLLGNTR